MNKTNYDEFISCHDGHFRDYQEVSEQLTEYYALLRQWNDRVRLVSRKYLECLDDHALDSLCLGPYLVVEAGAVARVLDIGSGGGFPGIPLAVCCPGLEFRLLERSERKVAFLERVVQRLGLSGVKVHRGAFPETDRDEGFDFVTARAVDRPETLVDGISQMLRNGSGLLCQSERLLEALGGDFPVELVDDKLDRAGYRRGRLNLVGSRRFRR